MPEIVFFEWDGREHEREPKKAEWYWTLGIVGLALAVASILFEQYLLTALIVIAAAVIALHAAKEPRTHHFKIIERGLMIGPDLHPYDKMQSFSLLEDSEGNLPPLLSIKTDSFLTPHLLIPLDDDDADGIYEHFLERVLEEEHTPTFTDTVGHWIGF